MKKDVVVVHADLWGTRELREWIGNEISAARPLPDREWFHGYKHLGSTHVGLRAGCAGGLSFRGSSCRLSSSPTVTSFPNMEFKSTEQWSSGLTTNGSNDQDA
jgi:hypothetical protein